MIYFGASAVGEGSNFQSTFVADCERSRATRRLTLPQVDGLLTIGPVTTFLVSYHSSSSR